MTEGGDDTEKQHEPSQKRLEDARQKGQIARSPDLLTAASYGGFIFAAAAMGATSLRKVGEVGMSLIADADRLAPQVMKSGGPPLAGLLLSYAQPVAPLFLFPAAAALALVLAQNALVFTRENLMPQISRLSPVSGLKNRLGRAGLFEFGKSFFKLLLISLFVGWYLVWHLDEIIGMLYLTPGLGIALLMQMLLYFLMIIAVLAALIGAVDYFWQRMEHLRRNRMSRQDLMDELKGSEGDPQMKAHRRRKGYDIATNRMLAGVNKADVVVVNPTHYAVALKWTRGQRQAPVCLAKGVDEIAQRIRERAAETGVPLHRDPPTARALYATVEIGQEIRPEHYRAVAAAIRFAEAMRRKKKGTM